MALARSCFCCSLSAVSVLKCLFQNPYRVIHATGSPLALSTIRFSTRTGFALASRQRQVLFAGWQQIDPLQIETGQDCGQLRIGGILLNRFLHGQTDIRAGFRFIRCLLSFYRIDGPSLVDSIRCQSQIAAVSAIRGQAGVIEGLLLDLVKCSLELANLDLDIEKFSAQLDRLFPIRAVDKSRKQPSRP